MLSWTHLSPPYRRLEAVEVWKAQAGLLVVEAYTVEGGAEVWRYDGYAKSPIVVEPISLYRIARGPYTTRELAQAAAKAELYSLRDQISAVLGATPAPK